MTINPKTLNEAAEANLRTGVLLLCKEALITAIQDRRLERGHLRVLAAVATFMSSSTAKAWPGRAVVAEVVGMSVRAVSNTLLELRKFGYLIADREAVEEANSRRLMVYTFGNIDHEEIRREITAFVHKVRDARSSTKVTAHGDVSPPTVNSEVTAHGESHRPRGTLNAVTSPQAGDSNSRKKDIPLAASGAAEAAPAPRKREAAIRTLLQKDWKPAPETVAWARANYVATDQQIAHEAEKFRNYHVSRGNRMADWPAAWRTWWGNGFHKIQRRAKAVGAEFAQAAASGGDNELAAAMERARLADEAAAKCQR